MSIQLAPLAIPRFPFCLVLLTLEVTRCTTLPHWMAMPLYHLLIFKPFFRLQGPRLFLNRQHALFIVPQRELWR